MIASLRTSFNGDEAPYLMARFGPCTADTFSATTLRSSPMSSYQMARCREAIVRSPTSSVKDEFRFCAYANRRIFPGMVILMGRSDEEEASLGKWQQRPVYGRAL